MTTARVMMVGPVIRGVDADLADAVAGAMEIDNPEAEVVVDDHGGYIRISVPQRGRLTRASLSRVLGRALPLSALAPSLAASAGRMTGTDDEIVWVLERDDREAVGSHRAG